MSLQPGKHLGQIVEVKFLDHVSSGEAEQELALCTVWGRLVHDDWQMVRVRTWEVEEGDPDEDAEFITLIRAAIHSIKPMVCDKRGEIG